MTPAGPAASALRSSPFHFFVAPFPGDVVFPLREEEGGNVWG